MFRNKKEKEKFIDDIFDILNRIKRLTGIDYDFTIVLEKDDSEEDIHVVGHEKAFAKVEINVYYHSAQLTLFPAAVRIWRKKDFFGLTSSLCHEVSHTLTEPLQDLIYQPHRSKDEIKRENEYATEKIGRIIYDLHWQTHKKNLNKNGKYVKVAPRKKVDKKKKAK